MHSDISAESITLIPREPRVPMRIEVEVMELRDETSQGGTLENLHERGLCVRTGMRVQPGEGLGVEIPAQPGMGGRVSIFAEVRWVEAGRVGLSIGGMLPHHRERLRRLLAMAGAATVH